MVSHCLDPAISNNGQDTSTLLKKTLGALQHSKANILTKGPVTSTAAAAAYVPAAVTDVGEMGTHLRSVADNSPLQLIPLLYFPERI